MRKSISAGLTLCAAIGAGHAHASQRSRVLRHQLRRDLADRARKRLAVAVLVFFRPPTFARSLPHMRSYRSTSCRATLARSRGGRESRIRSPTSARKFPKVIAGADLLPNSRYPIGSDGLTLRHTLLNCDGRSI
jgi:hypothetical protein